MGNINIPAIRFPNFDNDWERVKLGDISSWYSGGTPSKKNDQFWNGTIPWISASSMRGNEYGDSKLKISQDGLKSGSRLAKKGSLLLLVRGSMLFNKIPIGIATKDVAFNQDVKAIKIESKSTSKYILYYLNSNENKLLSIVSGTGIGAGKLDLGDLKAFAISMPTLPEQQKIASFFTAIDKKISQLKRKKTLLEHYKKGVMQKIFSQEIRFRDDNGQEFPKWEKKRLEDLLIESSEKTSISNQHRILSSTAKGIFNQDEYFNRDIASKDNSGYKILRMNQLVFSPQNLWLGNINVNTEFEIGIVSPSYKIFSFNREFTTAQYCKYYLTIPEMMFEYEQASEQGASVVRRNLSMDIFLGIRINLPALPEQTKIADFLSSIDDKILHTQTQIEKAELWKKGLLQKMFV